MASNDDDDITPGGLWESGTKTPNSLRKSQSSPDKTYAARIAAKYGDVDTAKTMAPGSSAHLTAALRNAMPRDKTGKPAGKVLGSFAKGGNVKRTGLYKLHKGERVRTAGSVRKSR